MRKQPLVNDEYYHIYNRGVDKRDIFLNKENIKRFLESITEFNQINKIGSLRNFQKTKNQTALKALSGKEKKPLVSVVGFCLNPNHFHFILKQLEDGGIAKFMQRLQGGYTYYFNVKHSRSGALFQGTFKSHLISGENYFNKILGYVNNNYEIHDIPQEKMELVFAGDQEYRTKNFKIISRIEGERILEIFGGSNGFEKHCKEIVSIIRTERGKTSLLEEDKLPDSA